MRISYPSKDNFSQALKEAHNDSVDLIVIVTAAFEPISLDSLKTYLADCVRVLKNGGLLYVQGRPDYLPELGVYLDKHLNFKYWIAIESTVQQRGQGLPSVHAAVLLFTKGNHRFNVKRIRFPHEQCTSCGEPLRDWGGKKHLMHPGGYVISDIWASLPPANNYSHLSAPVLDTILRMVDFDTNRQRNGATFPEIANNGHNHEVIGIVGPKESVDFSRFVAESPFQYVLPGFTEPQPVSDTNDVANDVSDKMFNVVHRGDALKVLRRYPDSSIDLVFADPPYNLDKPYNVYDDEQEDRRYIEWCNSWLKEYARVLKPTGSLFVLNLPRWTIHHAAFLNQHLSFQNWIVWDALSEPRGKLMPAHYGLLFYTKHPTDFTFNYDQVSPIDARYYCLRATCVRKRKALGADGKELLTDLWWDIHRIKHRRDRDHHPCQLPESLMERIIRLSTKPGDIVLDAFSGAGTTAVTALRLGRRYVAIDLDERYVRITKEKIAEVERRGFVRRKTTRKSPRAYTKKELQLDLRDLAARLGRLPTPDDVEQLSKYDLQVFLETFPTWGKALKAAKLEVLA